MPASSPAKKRESDETFAQKIKQQPERKKPLCNQIHLPEPDPGFCKCACEFVLFSKN